MRKRILLLATGGTIASEETPYGLIPALKPEDLLSYLPELELGIPEYLLESEHQIT